MTRKVGIVNLGLGNIGSIINSIKRLDIEPIIINNGQELIDVSPTHIIMPGVGAVGEAMQSLNSNNFIDPLSILVNKNNCFFCGICLGMQVLCEYSEEFGYYKCLGWIPGKVKKLNSEGLSLPHMGWNSIKTSKNCSNIFKSLNESDMYFAHSYTVFCSEEYVECRTTYGNDFISAISKKNIYGIQFHPEKSAKIGNIFFQKFLELGQS